MESLEIKLEKLERRYTELGAMVSDPEIIQDRELYKKYLTEHSELEEVVSCFKTFKVKNDELKQAREVLKEENDDDIKEMAKEEISELEVVIKNLEDNLTVLLLPKDPNDAKNSILEIRAGTGGDEAALFAQNLFEMYTRFADSKSWKVQVLSSSESSVGGFKELIAQIDGQNVFSYLKYERGVHRVQRVPQTESQGRVHTSTVTVAVLPEAEEVDLEINEKDLRVDVYRSSGPGGQSVNTTDSAVRITHIPTNTVVTCQDEKSQHKNRAKAMNVLRARLLDKLQAEQQAEIGDNRRSQIGSGERAEKIRTYNYPQGRITDHRINLTLYNLETVLSGKLEHVIDPLIKEEQAALLLDSAES